MSKINSFINEMEAQRLIQDNKYEEALPLLKKALTSGEYISREVILQNIALCYIKLDMFNDALPYLEQVININGNNTAAQYNLAYSYYKLRQYQNAAKRFLHLEEEEGMTPDIAYHLSICLLMSDRLQEAQTYFTYLIENIPSPDLVYNLGLELIQLDNARSARDIFILYLEKYENDIDATFGLGISYIECKQYYQAIECLERVTDWDNKKYPSAFTMLGVAYFQIGKIKEAFAHIRNSLQLDQNSYEAWYYLGIIYEQGKQIDEAIEAFQKAINLNPDSFEVWEHLGFIHFNEKRYPEACASFKKAYLLSKSSKYAYQIGLIYMLQEKFKSAVDYFTLSIEDDQMKEALENISICYYHLKEYQKVIDLLGPMDQEQMGKAILHFILGSSYMKLGQIEDARKNLSIGHKHFPSEVNILYSLGLLEANDENFKEACRFFENALIINRSPEILYALALAKMQLKESQDAIQYLNEYQMFVETDPEDMYKLGLIYLQISAVPNAIEAFKRVIDISPEHSKAKEYLKELGSTHE